jgi:hypothetical protein
VAEKSIGSVEGGKRRAVDRYWNFRNHLMRVMRLRASIEADTRHFSAIDGTILFDKNIVIDSM